MNGKYSGHENHDLTKIQISSLEIGGRSLYIEDDIVQKLEIRGRRFGFQSVSSKFINFVSVYPREMLKKSGLKLDNASFWCYDKGITP